MSKRTRIPGNAHALHQHLAQLDVEGVKRRIRQMAAANIGEVTTAELLGLRVDYVREVLADHTNIEKEKA